MKKIIGLVAVVVVLAIIGLFMMNGGLDFSFATPSPVPTATPEVTATPEPRVTPEPTAEPTQEPEKQATIEIRCDELGKEYYFLTHATESDLINYLYEEVKAVEAVNAIECVNYGASMVIDSDDPRIVRVEDVEFTAYNLYMLQESLTLKVKFNRDGCKLFAYEPDRVFEHSERTNVTFAGMKDELAYEAWICQEHGAVKSSVLLYAGYPASQGYRGEFKTDNGFNPEVLKAIRLVNFGEGRYDWVLVKCQHGATQNPVYIPDQNPTNDQTQAPTNAPTQTPTDVPTQAPTNAPTHTPTDVPTQAPTATPTQRPTDVPTQAPTSTPAHEPEATLPPKQTTTPEHEPEATLPPKQTETPEAEATEEPDDDDTTSSGPAHSTETTLTPEVNEEATSAPNPTLPPKADEEDSEEEPNLGGITW